MSELISNVKTSAYRDLDAAATPDALEAVRVKYLGVKGEIKQLLKAIGGLAPDARKDFAQAANQLRDEFQAAFDAKKQVVADSGEPVIRIGRDASLPLISAPAGSLHPVTLVKRRFETILERLGYRYVESPEIDTEWNCFDSLNMPDWHPARDSHDTFFTGKTTVLRTHTTSFQMRAMKLAPPPIRAFTFGRCYRSDKPDARHSVMFHQLDVVAIDEDGVSFGHLKGLLDTLLRSVFGNETELRFRPSFFPFTGISAEVDATCMICGGSGKSADDPSRNCPVCKGGGWIELLGSGVVRPEVLRNGGLDPDSYGGFAFGMGLDRVAMLLSRVPDLRMLFESDSRFLAQFPASV